MEGPGGYKNELDGIPRFLLAYWGIYDHSFIHLFGQQKFSTCSILGTEGTAGTNKSKTPNSRSSDLVTGDTAGEDIRLPDSEKGYEGNTQSDGTEGKGRPSVWARELGKASPR